MHAIVVDAYVVPGLRNALDTRPSLVLCCLEMKMEFSLSLSLSLFLTHTQTHSTSTQPADHTNRMSVMYLFVELYYRIFASSVFGANFTYFPRNLQQTICCMGQKNFKHQIEFECTVVDEMQGKSILIL